ncbi:MAG: hypothetical protein H7Y03_13035 [Chitinophagaceae bacterium]|nr:hypothetical protein [Chitinophagaceae bacterium]
MSRFIILISSLILLSSCSISINSTNYKDLTQSEKALYAPFDAEITKAPFRYTDSFKVYEIDYNSIREIARTSNKKVWLHFFAPWCKGISCENLNYVNEIGNKYSDSLTLIFVATAYDYPNIRDKMKGSKVTRPVYVLDGNVYGSNISGSQKKFYQDLTQASRRKYSDDYLLNEDGTLIYFKPFKLPVDSFAVKLDALVSNTN